MSITKETLRQFQGMLTGNAYKAGISTSDQLTAYNLEEYAKLLVPEFFPIRKMTPRVTPPGNLAGIQPNWKQITSFNSASVLPYVNEGNRGALLNYETALKSAPYVTLGLENNATFEAESAAIGFDNVDELATKGLMYELFRQEEGVIIGGNGTNGFLLGQPGVITLTDEASGGSLAAVAYTVGCVALTNDGLTLTTTNNAVPQVVSNANAGPYAGTTTFNGGASPAAATQTITPGGSGHSVIGTVPAVNGAVGYAWFLGTGGAAWFAGISTINSFNFTAVPSNTGQVYSTLSTVTDYSQNALAFSGMMSFTTSSGYVYQMATGTAAVGGAGTGLTPLSQGVGIQEFETVLQYMWNNYKTDIGVIWVNAQELNNITNKLFSSSSGSNLSNIRINYTPEQVQAGTIIGGATVGQYLNKYTMGGQAVIPIKLHPYVPAGTILFQPLRIPYQVTNVGDIMRMNTRKDVYQLQWPLTTRTREWGIYEELVLQCYAPFTFAMITNIANK